MLTPLTGLFATKPDPTTTDPATVIAEMLGREHAGKTSTRAITDPATVIAKMLGREHAGKPGTRAMTIRIAQQGRCRPGTNSPPRTLGR